MEAGQEVLVWIIAKRRLYWMDMEDWDLPLILQGHRLYMLAEEADLIILHLYHRYLIHHILQYNQEEAEGSVQIMEHRKMV